MLPLLAAVLPLLILFSELTTPTSLLLFIITACLRINRAPPYNSRAPASTSACSDAGTGYGYDAVETGAPSTMNYKYLHLKPLPFIPSLVHGQLDQRVMNHLHHQMALNQALKLELP